MNSNKFSYNPKEGWKKNTETIKKTQAKQKIKSKMAGLSPNISIIM